MIVSWNWLKQYVPLDMPLEELQRRLMMAGLNHEGTEQLGDDLGDRPGGDEQSAGLLEPYRHRAGDCGAVGLEVGDSRRAAAGRQNAGREAGQGADRLPGPLPAI